MSEHTHYYETGGGVVINEAGAVLLLERHVPREEGLRHEVRLPKGHIDPGESPEETALREVCEESGYCALTILAPLGESLIRYEHRGERVLRREFYFLMRLEQGDRQPIQAHPDSEEALFTVRWASFEDAIALLTYEAEKQVARRAQVAWEAQKGISDER